MAISYVAYAQANSGSSSVTSVDVTIPSTVQAGDACFIIFTAYSNASGSATLSTSSTGTAWTQLGTTEYEAATNMETNSAVFYLSAGSSDASKVVTCSSSASLYMNAVLVAYRGAATSGLVDVSNVTGSSTATATMTTPSVTTVSDQDWIIYLLSCSNGTTGYSSCTAPSGTTMREANFGSASGIAAAADSAAAVSSGSSEGGGSFTPDQTGTYVTWTIGLKPAVTTISGTASLSGSGSLAASGALAGTVALSGDGTLGNPAGTWTVTGLSGSGTLNAIPAETGAALSGSGSLGASGAVTRRQAAALSGSGSLNVTLYGAALDGSGTLGISGLLLGFRIALSGTGSLSIPQVAGGLVAGVGGASVPYAFPGSSQVSVAAPGSGNWQFLGTIGQVTALSYGFTYPGGCDKLTATVMVPAAYRTQMLNPGWDVRVTRGGHQVWHGKLDEPVPSRQGWTLTAIGHGNRGTDFRAIYTGTWPYGQPDGTVNAAISRGLPWTNPGIGSPSGIWLGQAVDSGAQTITALLNLACTRGGLAWYVNSQPGGDYAGDTLTVAALPTTVDRLLVCTEPVPRTLGGDVNTIYIRYQSGADNATTGTTATYGLTSVQDTASVTAHGVLETYFDISDAGVLSSTAAQAVGSSVLEIYKRASFAGPFTASYGQLLNAGGTPIDPGTDQAGTVIRLILTDYGYGGEVTPQYPITFITGSYEWDDFAQVATITPYQNLDQSLTGLLSMENTMLRPITAAGPL